MKNPQKFNIINPKRGSCEALYEKVDSVPIWRRCLRYCPRAKDFRIFNPLRNKIRQIPGTVRKFWSRNHGGVQSKPPVSSKRKKISKAPPASIPAAQTTASVKHFFVPKSVPVIQTTAPKLHNPGSFDIATGDSEAATISGELGIERVQSSVYEAPYEPHQPYTPLYPNHEIGVAFSTSQKILNYPNFHNDKGQEKSDREGGEVVIFESTASGKIVPTGGGVSGMEREQPGLTGIVDISTLVPDYTRPRKKLVETIRPVVDIQHHSLPHSSSTKNLVQLLEKEASRKEQETKEDRTYRDFYLQKPRTPRDSRRCGHVWDSEEARNSFLTIEALTHDLSQDLELT